MNATIIFQTRIDRTKCMTIKITMVMSVDDRMKMAESCGLALRKLIHTITGLGYPQD